MKKRLIIAGIVASILGLIFYFNTSEDKSRSVKRKQERIFISTLDELNKVEHNFSATDYVVFDDFIYLKDFKNQQIVKISLDGKLIGRFGSKGEGPTENLMIRGFAVDTEGIRTIDARKNTISKISYSDSLLYSYKPKTIISIGGFIGEENAILKGVKGSNNNRRIDFNLFQNGKLTSIDLKGIFPDKKNSDWIYDGFFTGCTDGGTVYVTHFSNKFLKFDSKGKLVFSKHFIYEVPEIKLQMEGDAIFPVENDKANIYSCTSNGEFIFFQTSVGDNKKPDQMIVDIYSESNGEYVSSLPIKEDASEGFPNAIRAYKDKLILFYPSMYKVYDIVKN